MTTFTLSIAGIVTVFPQARIALVVLDGLSIDPVRPDDLDALIAEREAQCRARWRDTELSAVPGIAAWRTAYRGFGIKKTSYRSSVERLVKRVLAGERLPAINALVDVYNAVSLSHVLCCGADDAAMLTPDLAFRYARDGDSFLDMGAVEGEDPNDPPKQGEVVYADGRHVLCRRWNWRQDARSAITPATRRAVVTVQGNGAGDLDAAIADLTTLAARYCQAGVRFAIADANRPIVSL